MHRKLPGYAPTPLADAPAIAVRLGLGRVLVKDESSRLGLPAFKMLGASWAVYRAIAERAEGSLGPWEDVSGLRGRVGRVGGLSFLAAATDGNHGRAVARMASMLGLGCRVYVPAGTAAARIVAIESEGASVAVVEGTYDDAVARSAEDAAADCLVISDTSWPGYERVPRWVMEGYSTIFSEIDAELRAGEAVDSVDAVAVQIGVGALCGAAVACLAAPGRRRPQILGVEPLSAACMLASVRAGRPVTLEGAPDSLMAGLNCGTPSQIAFPVVAAGVDAFVAIPDAAAEAAMRELAGVGVVSGETGAAGLGGVSSVLAAPAAAFRERHGLDAASTLLLISTEGATDPASYRRIVGMAPEEVRRR
ncbi:MAG: diaminopropionate ammonia-lyase [Acidimicrobiales bacterium]